MHNEKELQQEKIECPQCNKPDFNLQKAYDDFKIIQCSSCGLIYAWPRVVPTELYDNAYKVNGEYSKYLSLSSEIEQGKSQLTWSMKRFLNSNLVKGNLLDIGCSTGTFLMAAKERGWQVNGIEVSSNAANICGGLTGAEIHIGTLETFSSKKEFDAITTWEVLEHIPEPLIFLKKAYTLLKRGGVLGLSVPNWASPWMRNSKSVEHWPPFHLNFWTPNTLNRLLSDVGYQKIVLAEKPFAWEEEIGRRKWLYLPLALFRSYFLHQKGMHIFVMCAKV